MVAFMEEVLIAFRHKQQENQAFHEFIAHLQCAQASTSLGYVSMTPSQVKEPQISLPNKFDGMCSKFRSFFNQVQLYFVYS